MYRDHLVDEFLEVDDIHRMDWAVNSPALIRTENTLDVLGKLSNQKVDLPTYLGVTLDPGFSKHIEQNYQQSSWKTEYSSKAMRNFWGSRPQTLKSTFCTVIRPVLEYATPIWTPASISVKRKLDSYRALIGAVSSTNNEKVETRMRLSAKGANLPLSSSLINYIWFGPYL
ncbi:hypothetical protein TNCV_1253391 [Trichonephila clavipes]|nr:hypothetical protein TNCV_1253391 [Trichonephila clavipes]